MLQQTASICSMLKKGNLKSRCMRSISKTSLSSIPVCSLLYSMTQTELFAVSTASDSSSIAVSLAGNRFRRRDSLKSSRQMPLSQSPLFRSHSSPLRVRFSDRTSTDTQKATRCTSQARPAVWCCKRGHLHSPTIGATISEPTGRYTPIHSALKPPEVLSARGTVMVSARESPGTSRTLVEPSPGLGMNPAILEKEAMLAKPTAQTSSKHKTRRGGGEEEERRSARLRSWYAHMVLINLAEFSAEAARGLVLPTLFTYSQELGGDIVFMGLLTSLFSVGRFVSSLLFGWLCDRISFRALYNIAGTVSVVGNILYIIPYTPSVRSKALLGLSRCVVGFGAGNRSVCRANIAMLTNVNQRLEYFTVFATVVFLAYALTPGLGGVFGDIDVKVAGDYLELNRFTAPGFLLAGLNVMTIILNNLIFDPTISRDDAPGAPDAKPSESLQGKGAVKTEEGTASSVTVGASAPVLSERMVAIGAMVFIFLNFNARGILSVFETVNIPLFLQTTNRTDVESEESFSATKDASSFYFLVGLLGLVSYAAVQLLGKRVSDVSFLIFGFAMLLVGNALLIVLCMLMSSARNEASHFDLFVVSEIFVWSIGCPLISAVVVSAFSKVLGTRPQGMLMGIFGSSASIARMVMPFLPGVLPSWQVLFLVNMVLCASCIVALVLYLRLTKKAAAAASYESVLIQS